MSDEPTKLTPEQAIAMLPDGDEIHTFLSSSIALLGADWPREDIIEKINSCPCELGGPACTRMNHGLVIWLDTNTPLFVECRKAVTA